MSVHYPGLGIGFQRNNLELEFRWVRQGDVSAYGTRLKHHFADRPSYNFYLGGDSTRISFSGNNSEGTGNSAGIFAGGRYFFLRSTALNVDVGPYWIQLEDDSTGTSNTGVQYIVNFSINFYPGQIGRSQP